MKLNVLLAKTEHGASSFSAMIKEFLQFFKKEQGAFKGVKKTYQPRENTVDEPGKRGITKVATTVTEKLSWLEETSAEYINNLFSVEATNASGAAMAELKVDGISLGTLSTLELLRLKSLLDSDGFEDMYQHIPVRSDTEIWRKTTEELYTGREIYENEMSKGVSRTETREEYILADPNLQYLKEGVSYQPLRSVRTHPTELGDYTVQHFSGELTHRERAQILRRRSRLKEAVIQALKVANEVPVVESVITAQKIFGYLHRGPAAFQ